jgi:hypothetical protein
MEPKLVSTLLETRRLFRLNIETMVVDLDWFNMDPDPDWAFLLNPDLDPDPSYNRTFEDNFFLKFFWNQNLSQIKSKIPVLFIKNFFKK